MLSFQLAMPTWFCCCLLQPRTILVLSVVGIVCDGSLHDVVLLSLQTVNPDYKQRLMKLANLVLVKFTEDTMVQPRESEVLTVHTCIVTACITFAFQNSRCQPHLTTNKCSSTIPAPNVGSGALDEDFVSVTILVLLCCVLQTLRGIAKHPVAR